MELKVLESSSVGLFSASIDMKIRTTLFQQLDFIFFSS